MKFKTVLTSLARASYTKGFLLALLIHSSVFIFLNGNPSSSVMELSFHNEEAVGNVKKRFLIPMQLGPHQKTVHNGTLPNKSQTPSQSEGTAENAPAPGEQTSSSSPNSPKESTNSFESAIIYFEEPVYPLMARKKGIEGTLLLSMTINAHEGTVQDYKIIKSSGTALLDEAVKKAVARWRFKERSDLATYQVEKTFIFKIK